ncbi:hypothetical protein ANN_07727 [Periplaneta americana]|uniref:Uncharacterized protein n=1 Tax=Periplaneta americana TaxID=6978 RepID=A0ABQ8SZE4_PERAM|nr:hypothetical protein ANN_07727 [Periplaneta americana]
MPSLVSDRATEKPASCVPEENGKKSPPAETVDRLRNTDIRIRSGMQDAVRLALRLKWKWGVHKETGRQKKKPYEAETMVTELLVASLTRLVSEKARASKPAGVRLECASASASASEGLSSSAVDRSWRDLSSSAVDRSWRDLSSSAVDRSWRDPSSSTVNCL